MGLTDDSMRGALAAVVIVAAAWCSTSAQGTADGATACPSKGRQGKTEPTVDVLRRKLDTAIVAEAWAAVKVIRERIVEAERTAAQGNVIPLRSSTS
jgi:hypothetical protein